MELSSISESPIEDESGESPRFSQSGATFESASALGTSYGQHAGGLVNVHHRHGSQGAVRDFIETNQEEASKIEHEHEGGCGMIDFYAYEPRVMRRVYRSWTGCFFSHVSLVIFLTVIGVAWWQFYVLPFHIILGETALDPSMQVSATSDPPLPAVGLDFRLANGSSFFNPAYLTYSFARKTIYSQDKLPRKSVSLNYSRCEFTAGEDDAVVATAMCPDRSQTILQGIFSNAVYSYLQLDITPCINRSSSSVVCQPNEAILALIAGGTSVIMGNAGTVEIKDITVPSKLVPSTTYTSFRYDLTETFYQKVDVLLTPRDIIKKSSVVDIDQWRDKATDIFFSGVEPTIRDRAAADPLIRYYLRLDTISQEVELEPYKNVVDLAEMLGAFKALLDLLLGIPLRYLNQWFFLRDVKKEVRRGALKTDMLLPNSNRPKPNRLQSIMRHIHSVQQQDSLRRTSGHPLLSRFMNAKERVKKIFKAREPGRPESPTRTPLRSARDSGQVDPAEPPSASSHRLSNGGEHSVWIDLPEPWSAEPPARSQTGGLRSLMELSERNPLYDAESDTEQAGPEPRYRSGRKGVQFAGELTWEENGPGSVPSKQGPKGVPFNQHSANPLQGQTKSSFLTDGSRIEDLWTSESAGGRSERHVTNPLFFQDERSDETSAATPQNPRSTERDDAGRAIGVESLHTARLSGHHRSSAPGALLKGMSPLGLVAGKGPSGPGIGQGGAKELKVPYKRSSLSS